MFIPPNCKSLAEMKQAQIRLGIQGYPGEGKTFGALTFPNPVVANLDRGLGAHAGRKDIIEVPFYDEVFCKTIHPKFVPSELKFVLLNWLEKVAVKLEADQTLVWDGCTGLQNAYHRWWRDNPTITQEGNINTLAEWGDKLKFFGEVTEIFKTLKCHVVFITHELDAKDKKGNYTGKLKPLLTGQFGEELNSHFTDWFRQLSSDKPTDYNAVKDETLKNFGMTRSEFKAWCESFPRNTIYYWQTEGSDLFSGKCSSLVNFPRFIPANFSSFQKYARKIS